MKFTSLILASFLALLVAASPLANPIAEVASFEEFAEMACGGRCGAGGFCLCGGYENGVVSSLILDILWDALCYRYMMEGSVLICICQ